jgi:hypothetical protein
MVQAKDDGYDIVGVESIVEDLSSLHARIPFIKNLDDSLQRADEE